MLGVWKGSGLHRIRRVYVGFLRLGFMQSSMLRGSEGLTYRVTVSGLTTFEV